MIKRDGNINSEDLLLCIEEFVNESEYKLTYSKDNTLEFLSNIGHDPESTIIAVYKNNTIAGFAVVTVVNECHREYFGYVMKFYIRKTHRGTQAARMLRDAVDTWFNLANVVDAFITTTAMIGEDQLLHNLLAKTGWKSSGIVMRKNYV